MYKQCVQLDGALLGGARDVPEEAAKKHDGVYAHSQTSTETPSTYSLGPKGYIAPKCSLLSSWRPVGPSTRRLTRMLRPRRTFPSSLIGVSWGRIRF